MKKILFVFMLAALFAPLFITAETVESEFYTVDLMMTMISPHPLGYKVVYYDRYAQLREVYLPIEWFKVYSGEYRGEIIYGEGREYPYMKLVYKNGELSHIQLYVFGSSSHPTWGTMSRQVDYSEKFDIEFSELEIKF